MANKLKVFEVNTENHASEIIRKLRSSQASKLRYQASDFNDLALNISELNSFVTHSSSGRDFKAVSDYGKVNMITQQTKKSISSSNESVDSKISKPLSEI
jgi:hypothetical protein